MIERRSFARTIAAAVILISTSAFATDWPQWRGPFFNGSTDEVELPASWGQTKNVAWVAPLPGPSGATPLWSDERKPRP